VAATDFDSSQSACPRASWVPAAVNEDPPITIASKRQTVARCWRKRLTENGGLRTKRAQVDYAGFVSRRRHHQRQHLGRDANKVTERCCPSAIAFAAQGALMKA